MPKEKKWVAVPEDELDDILAMARTLVAYHAPTCLCPNCKEYYMEEGLVCPGCRHDASGDEDDNLITTAEITRRSIGPKEAVVKVTGNEKLEALAALSKVMIYLKKKAEA